MGDAINAVIGDANGPPVEEVLLALVEDNILVDNPVQPIPVNLDNLIWDIDLGIDEIWREGRMLAPSSCYTSVGSNAVIDADMDSGSTDSDEIPRVKNYYFQKDNFRMSQTMDTVSLIASL